MTQDELKSRLHYDPETGIFTWLDRPDKPAHWRSRYPGTEAGTLHKFGYRGISISKKRYYAHRLAWLYVYGYTPKEIDHIDGDPSNNKLCNLRSADRNINMKNLRRNSVNKSGKTGVCWDKSRGKWMAYINVDGKRVKSKRFANRTDADLFRDWLSQKYDFHDNHGRD